jgi:hypothetical protein
MWEAGFTFTLPTPGIDVPVNINPRWVKILDELKEHMLSGVEVGAS